MSEIVDRAAKALWEVWERSPWEKRRDVMKEETRKEIRAALLAALDPEDDKLTERIAKRIYLGRNYGEDHKVMGVKWADPRMREAYRADAHNALLALRSIVNDTLPPPERAE